MLGLLARRSCCIGAEVQLQEAAGFVGRTMIDGQRQLLVAVAHQIAARQLDTSGRASTTAQQPFLVDGLHNVCACVCCNFQGVCQWIESSAEAREELFYFLHSFSLSK